MGKKFCLWVNKQAKAPGPRAYGSVSLEEEWLAARFEKRGAVVVIPDEMGARVGRLPKDVPLDKVIRDIQAFKSGDPLPALPDPDNGDSDDGGGAPVVVATDGDPAKDDSPDQTKPVERSDTVMKGTKRGRRKS